MRMKCNYFVLIFFYSTWKNLVLSTSVAAKSGPFKTVVLNIHNKCDNVVYPYEKVPTGYVYVKILNLPNGTQVMRTNITVLRSNRGIMMRIKVYKWDNNKWNIIIFRNNIGCSSAIFPLLVQQTGLDIDMNLCSVPKGLYRLKDVNLDDADHIVTQKREYGRHKWRVEVYLKSATVTCIEYETAIVPAASSS